MRSCFHVLLLLSLYLQHSVGVTTKTRNPSSQLNTLEALPNMEPSQHPIEPIVPVINERKSNNGKTDNLADARVVDYSGRNSDVPKVIKKRVVGTLLSLAPAALDVFGGLIKNLFGMSREQVETQGLTNEQFETLLMASAKASCSGAAGLLLKSVTSWQILSVVTIKYLLGISF